MNVKLLRRIQRQILKEPRQFDMRAWFRSSPKIPNCKTAACIAGWAVSMDLQLTPYRTANTFGVFGKSYGWMSGFHSDKVMPEAQKVLSLTKLQARRLFFRELWPLNYDTNYQNADTPREKAKIAVARISHFIKTNGAE